MSQGANPVDLKRGLEKGCELVVEKLKDMSMPVTNLENIASISANDEATGKIIAEAIKMTGRDGYITIERSGSMVELTTDIIDGMKIDAGWRHDYFATDHAKGEATYLDPHILITDKPIRTLADAEPIFIKMKNNKIPELTIISSEVSDDMISAFVSNHVNPEVIFNFLVVNAPSAGENRRAIMEDIAIMTGGTFVSTGKTLKDVEISDLGRCKKIISNKICTVITGGAGEKVLIDERVELIKKQLEEEVDNFERDRLKQRIARLTGGIGVINVGGVTETAQTELKHRVEDAVNATRAAQEEGIVAGGGIALLRAREIISGLTIHHNKDFVSGAKVLYSALEMPAMQILINAGREKVLKKIKKESGNYGYDAREEMFGDMIEMGIIDPLKVVRSALQNAVSIAGYLLMSEVATSEIKK